MEPAVGPPTPLDEALEAVQAALDFRFREPALLADALRILFPPLSPEAAAARQRLEFLGDAAWDCAVAEAVLRQWPDSSPGELTRFRAAWTSAEGMARLSGRLGLPALDHPGLNGPSGRALAELLEAVFGAAMLDGGLAPLQALARRAVAAGDPPPLDPKSALQMLAQAHRLPLPTYRVLDRSGPPHLPRFRLEAAFHALPGDLTAQAEGPSRQAAEQEAARILLERLEIPGAIAPEG